MKALHRINNQLGEFPMGGLYLITVGLLMLIRSTDNNRNDQMKE